MSAPVSAHQAAARFGVNEKTVRRWIAAGKLRADKRDGVYQVSLEEVAALCGQRRGVGGPEAAVGGQAAAPDTGPSGSCPDPVADTPRPDAAAAHLADLVRELNAELVRKAEAAAMWQARADVLGSQVGYLQTQLEQARAELRALQAPQDAPETHTDARQPAQAPGPTRGASVPWWRRWLATLAGA